MIAGRVTWILDHFHGSTMLDIGCTWKTTSGFHLHKEIRKCNPNSLVIGLDIDPDLHALQYRPLIQASIYQLPFRNNSIDAVGCFEILEHLVHLDDALSEIHRVLKPGGTICLTTPNPLELWRLIRFVLTGRGTLDGHPDHKFLYDPLSLKETLKRTGFDNVTVETQELRIWPFSKKNVLIPYAFGPFKRLGYSLVAVGQKGQIPAH